jgi:hypothetical protein
VAGQLLPGVRAASDQDRRLRRRRLGAQPDTLLDPVARHPPRLAADRGRPRHAPIQVRPCWRSGPRLHRIGPEVDGPRHRGLVVTERKVPYGPATCARCRPPGSTAAGGPTTLVYRPGYALRPVQQRLHARLRERVRVFSLDESGGKRGEP